jgi:hypothetical protein
VFARYDTNLALLVEVRDGLRRAWGEGALRAAWLLLPWADEDTWPRSTASAFRRARTTCASARRL